MAAVGGSRFVVTDPTAPRREADPGVGKVAQGVAQTAAGRAPKRTGRLAAGWRTVKQGPSSYIVTNDVPYAKYVEFGTKNMPARPMLAPAVMAARASYGR